jgi:hypothetical protein
MKPEGYIYIYDISRLRVNLLLIDGEYYVMSVGVILHSFTFTPRILLWILH